MADLVSYSPKERIAVFSSRLDGVSVFDSIVECFSGYGTREKNSWVIWCPPESRLGVNNVICDVGMPFEGLPDGGTLLFSRKNSTGPGYGSGLPARFTVELFELLYVSGVYTSTTSLGTTLLTIGATDLDSTTLTVPASYTSGANHYDYEVRLKKIEVPWR